MSRSYRKPWCVDGYGTKGKKISKRFANKTVRNADDVPNGKAYRKYFESWNISDYRFFMDSEPYFSRITLQWEEPLTPTWKARRK